MEELLLYIKMQFSVSPLGGVAPLKVRIDESSLRAMAEVTRQ